MALAISDSLVLISNTFLDDFLGRGLYFLSDSKWIIKLDTYSVEACRTMELIGTWFVFTSGSLLVAFSLDRVACMCRPLQCRSNDGIRVALMVSILIAVLGFVLSLPQAMLYQLVYRPPKMIVDPRLISRDLRNANTSQVNVNGELIRKNRYCTVIAVSSVFIIITEIMTPNQFVIYTLLTADWFPCVCLNYWPLTIVPYTTG
ncbi:hypothetical protein AHF37_12606 [Paragonimus kellicotti]|nr:hypothetical protein AHF37_12606 [Paragonimus kellicotti]